jgi:hypothetical protein
MLKPKYQIDQTIYYIQNNKIHSAPILSRIVIENKYIAHTAEQKELFTPFGESGIRYVTCHGIFKEKYVRASKEELLKSL